MDFSVKTFGGQKTRYYESDTESSLQLVFLPGIFGARIWKHQLRYFAENFLTVAFETDNLEYGNQQQVMDDILGQDHLDNVVIVSQGLGNRLAREMEYREEIVATVMTGARKTGRTMPRQLYVPLKKAFNAQPKLFKKLFFSGISDYRVARQFLDDMRCPDYSEYSSFADGYRIRKPVKNSLMIHAQEDSFSSLDEARELKPGISVSVIRGAGSFSFYEKPQEYNKALLDFLSTLEGFVERREISKTRERNRSLKEFELQVKK